MQAGLVVGLGGFIGAVLRYEMGRIPLTSSFPVMTLVINVIGAFVIGLVAGWARGHAGMSPNMILFLQTGLCGGFTTFSAFSLETVNLLQAGQYLLGTLYIVLSVVLCLLATILGMALARSLAV